MTCPVCEELTGCQCALGDGTCIGFAGSGSELNPLAPASVFDPDPDNLATCTEDGLLVKLPAAILLPPACQAYNSSNISIPNDDGQVVALDSERYDTDTMHSTSVDNSRITFNTEGIYIVTFQGSWAGNVTGDRESWIRKNGSEYLGKDTKRALDSASFETGHSICVQEFFEVGEFVEAIVKQDSGGALNLLATRYSPILAVRYRRRAP